MSNYVLSATLQLKDQFTAEVNKARSGFRGLTDTMKGTGAESDTAAAKLGQVGTAAVKAAGQADRAKRSFQGIRGAYEATIRAKDTATGTINKVKTELNGLKGKVYTVALNVKANNNWQGMKNSMSGMASGMILGSGMQMAGTAGIGFGIYDAVKGYMDFEQEMSAVKAISGATDEEFKRLTDMAVKMGADTKYSAKESAQALEYMGMAGWKTDEMIAGLPGVMNLAAASGEELGRVSDIVTDAMTSFKLSASDAAMFSDVLAATATSSNTNVGKMGYTFQYVAPVAGALGYTIQDTALAIGAMADAGIKGEQAGTSLRALLTRMAAPTKQSAAAMAQLGLSVTDSAGNMRPLRDILAELRVKIKQLTPEQQAQVAADLAGQEAMSGLLGIINESDEKYDSLAKSIDNSAGAAKKMAGIRMDNLAGDLEYLSGDWDTFTMNLMKGDASSGLRDFIKEADKLLSNFSGMVDEHGLGVRSILSLIGETINDLKDKFLAFDGIGSVLAGGALAVGLKKIYDLAMKAKDVVQGIPKGVPGNPSGGLPGSSSVGDMIVTATNVIINSKGVPTSPNTNTPQGPAPGGTPKGQPVPKGVPKPGVASRLGGIAKRLPVIGGALALGSAALDFAYAPEGQGMSVLGRDAAGLAGGFAGMKAGGLLGAQIGGVIGSVIPGAGTAVGAGAGALIGGIAGGIGGDWAGQKLAESFQGINWDAISQTISEKNAGWRQTFSDTADYLNAKQNEVQQTMGDSWESIKEFGSNAWEQICQVADEKNMEWGQTFADAKQAAVSALTELSDGASNAWNAISNGASNLQNEIANAFSSAVNAAQNAFSGISRWFEANVWGPLSDRAHSVWRGIQQSVANIQASASSYQLDGGSIFPGHATGSSYYPGGWTEINERGGEIIDLPQGSRIYPHATTERMIKDDLQMGGRTAAPVIIKDNTFHVREEADIDRIAYAIAKLMQQNSLNYGGGY